AAATIRERYERQPDPDGLLEQPFTITELRSVHEAVIGEGLLKDTFRRRMEPQLHPLADAEGQPVLRSDGGRPAQVYVPAQDLSLTASTRRRLLLPRALR
ncbi:MAG: NrtR DNA-binding winged helix domain-containing protein, partial [Friedmanniella sp.]